MKRCSLWASSLLLLVAAVVTGQEPAAQPKKFKTPDECFAALQAASSREPQDYSALLACQSPAMQNVQVGQIAFHLTRGAMFEVLPKKDVDPFLIKHDLEDLDLFEVLQIASSRRDIGELRGFNTIGARVTDKVAFLKDSAAWMKKYGEAQRDPDAKQPKGEDPKPILKLANVETKGDTALADFVDNQGKVQGKACFRLIEGSWVLGFPGVEPKSPSFTKEQRGAIAELNKKGHVQIGDEESNFALNEFSITYVDEAGDAELIPLKLLPTFKAIHLAESQVTDAGLKHLESQTTLEFLDISDTKITEAGILSLTRHKQLKELALNNLDISPAALKSLQTALPTCEISHRWNLPWVIAGADFLDRRLKEGPVVVVSMDEASERRIDDWQKKLATREAVMFGRRAKLSGLMVFVETPENLKPLGSLKPVPGLDPKKIPQFLLFTKPGAKPIELSEKATGAELLATITKALGK